MIDPAMMTSEIKARDSLFEAAVRLEQAFCDAPIGLWDGDKLKVAPTRVAKAAELRAKGVQNWSSHDLDFVMFKCMTTMGDENTFKFLAPRFFKAYACDTDYLGWTSGPHVFLSKLQMLDLKLWKQSDIEPLFDAIQKYVFLNSLLASNGVANVIDKESDDHSGSNELLQFVAAFQLGN